jgi:hypothetical protein
MHCHIEDNAADILWLKDPSGLALPLKRAHYQDLYPTKLANLLRLADGDYKDYVVPPVQLSKDIADELRRLMLIPEFPQCSEAPTIRIPSALAEDLSLPNEPILVSRFFEQVENLIAEASLSYK